MDTNLLPKPAPHARWPLVGATIFVCTVLGGILLFEADTQWMIGKIYPGVSVSGVSLGGGTYEEAKKILNDVVEEHLDKGLTFVLDGEVLTIAPTFTASQDLDLTYDIARYNTDESIFAAFGIGRSLRFIETLTARLTARIRGIDLTPTVIIDIDRLRDALKINFAHKLTPAVNATFLFTSSGKLEPLPEKEGTTLTYAAAIVEATRRLEHFSDAPITIARIPEIPTVREADVQALLPKARTFIDRAPYTFTATINKTEFTYTITPERIGSWLTTASRDGHAVIDLDRARVDSYLTAIAPKIEVQPRDAKFSLTNGRVNEFQSGQRGFIIDREQTYETLRDTLLRDEKIDSIELVIQTIEPKQTTEAVNDLGIKELLGVGHSNFAGSPPNRRHNIRTGARALHGIIIAPGEEFSLLKALGEIDAANGYLPELVIKGNKTVPEFGGGLCQIGTTIFRATMASALPIVERQSHSYSVTYYLENGKPGKDATIYNPKPDYRFRNDTPAYILIQTRVEGDDLYFEFWGTSDGRTQEQTEVKTWGRRAPPPTKIIETEDLPVGKKRCTERAHIGISAEFTYIITMADGTKKEQTFRSTYRPWQEVCLLGVPKGTLEQKNGGAILPSADTTGTAGN